MIDVEGQPGCRRRLPAQIEADAILGHQGHVIAGDIDAAINAFAKLASVQV